MLKYFLLFVAIASIQGLPRYWTPLAREYIELGLFGHHQPSPPPNVNWCKPGQNLYYINQYVYRGMAPSADFTGMFPALAASDAELITTDADRLINTFLIEEVLTYYGVSYLYQTTAMHNASTWTSPIVDPLRGLCGATAFVNRTLCHPSPIPGTPLCAIELEAVEHYYRYTNNCSATNHYERQVGLPLSRSGCSELYYIREVPNSGLAGFFQPYLSLNATAVCAIISSFCDSLGANPYGGYDACVAYASELPQYYLAPCGIPGQINELGPSRGCLGLNAAQFYNAATFGTAAVVGICATLGADGTDIGISCTVDSLEIMDPQCSNPSIDGR